MAASLSKAGLSFFSSMLLDFAFTGVGLVCGFYILLLVAQQLSNEKLRLKVELCSCCPFFHPLFVFASA